MGLRGICGDTRDSVTFMPFLFSDRTAEEWTGNRGEREGMTLQQRATEGNRTHGRCKEDTASVYGAPALPTELPGTLTG